MGFLEQWPTSSTTLGDRVLAKSAEMGRIVIACYRPKVGMQKELRELTESHVPRLRAEGLVTERAPIVMEAVDGTIVEVFEWASQEAIERAHSNPTVQRMWEQYAAVCDYIPIALLEEAGKLFSELAALEP